MLVASGLAALSPPASGQADPEGTCGGGTVEVRGIVRDAATGLPLPETANVDIYPAGVGDSIDGGGTDAASRYTYCAPIGDGDIKIRFDADNYRPEWWNDQPNRTSATIIDVDAGGPVIANAALTPNGRVIAGRVTNMRGVPKFASVGIWQRQANGRWRSIDGEGNDERTGWYSYRVPTNGRYRVSACVDNHWCQWATSADRLRDARTVVVGPSTTFVNDVHVRVPFCRRSPPDFCVPWGFLT
jgi:hypothetical protein